LAIVFSVYFHAPGSGFRVLSFKSFGANGDLFTQEFYSTEEPGWSVAWLSENVVGWMPSTRIDFDDSCGQKFAEFYGMFKEACKVCFGVHFKNGH
jgi:hypothetical protein